MTTAFVSAFSGTLLRSNLNPSTTKRFATGLKHASRRLPTLLRTTTTRVICTASTPAADAGPEAAQQAINDSNIMVFSTTYCPFCARVKALFADLGVEHTVWEVDTMANNDAIRAWLMQSSGQRTVPNVFIRGKHIGGCDDAFDLHNSGQLMKLIEG